MIDHDVRHTDEQPGLLMIGDLMLRYWRLLLFVPLLVAAAAAAYSLLRPSAYSAESRFLPQTQQRGNSGLAGLAAQFGVNVNPAGANESPEFYAALIKTRDLLGEAAQTEYSAGARRGTLVELLGPKDAAPEDRLTAVIERLGSDVSTRPEPRTGMVVVRTMAPTPELAVAVNRRLLELVADFNLRKRQTQAAAERAFVEERVREAQQELERAESALENFHERNRQYSGSPQLAVQAARLDRRVQLRQEVYTSLAQAYEQARVDEVRNTPLITIVDRPDASVRRIGSGLVSNVILGLLLGLILAVGFALLTERLARESQLHPQEYARMRANIPRFIPLPPARSIAPVGAHVGDGDD